MSYRRLGHTGAGAGAGSERRGRGRGRRIVDAIRRCAVYCFGRVERKIKGAKTDARSAEHAGCLGRRDLRSFRFDGRRGNANDGRGLVWRLGPRFRSVGAFSVRSISLFREAFFKDFGMSVIGTMIGDGSFEISLGWGWVGEERKWADFLLSSSLISPLNRR